MVRRGEVLASGVSQSYMCRIADRGTRFRAEGITVCHRKGCSGRGAQSCRCRPAYQAQVFSPRDRRTIRKTFRTLAEARAWRSDTQAALRKGTMRAPTRTILEEAAGDWLEAARAGIARTRSGDPYKPSALRSYEEALRTKVLPELGRLRLSSVDRVAVQDLVDRLVAQDLALCAALRTIANRSHAFAQVPRAIARTARPAAVTSRLAAARTCAAAGRPSGLVAAGRGR